MKRVFSSLLVLSTMLFAFDGYARNVSVEEAKTAAAHYMRHNSSNPEVSANDLALVYQIDNEKLGVPASYFFNVGDWGFIIMAANTACDAVIGYGECGMLNPNNFPPAMINFVENEVEAVKLIQMEDEASNYEDTDEWDVLLNERYIPNPKATQVILMNERWGQGNDEGDSYNMFSPVINNIYCPTGCVATAAAQICHYYQFPKQGKGRHTSPAGDNGNGTSYNMVLKYDTMFFDYSKMPNHLSGTSTTEQRREISRLMYAIGVGVDMHYTPNGSGAQSSDVITHMKQRFKYEQGTMVYRRSTMGGRSYGVADSVFLKGLRGELMKNRPVYMGGASSTGDGRDAAGHAWVCCGYKTENDRQYYMNWGWDEINVSAAYSANGWFNLKSNNMPVSGYNFNVYQEYIKGMVPPQDSISIDITGIETPDATADLYAAFPNPAAYSVVLPYSASADGELVVYTMDGKMIERRSVAAGDGSVELNVVSYPAGIYIYRLNGATGKFIVQ